MIEKRQMVFCFPSETVAIANRIVNADTQLDLFVLLITKMKELVPF